MGPLPPLLRQAFEMELNRCLAMVKARLVAEHAETMHAGPTSSPRGHNGDALSVFLNGRTQCGEEMPRLTWVSHERKRGGGVLSAVRADVTEYVVRGLNRDLFDELIEMMSPRPNAGWRAGARR